MLARWTGGELVRLQCYEGIDAAQAVYEWDYSRQLLHLRAVEAGGGGGRRGRALLRAVPREAAAAARDRLRGRVARRGRAAGAARRRGRPRRRRVRGVPARDPLRLHDHGPRARHVPRRRCRRSSSSRRTARATCTTRSKRRCLYHWIAHPDFERELAILRVRAPEVPGALARQVAAAVEALRELELYKPPGCRRDDRLGATRSPRSARTELDERAVDVTLGTILKYREDQERTRAHGIDAARAARRWSAVPEPSSSDRRRRSAFARLAARRRARRAGRQHGRRSREALARRRDGDAATPCTGRAAPPWCAGPRTSTLYDRAFAAWWEREHDLELAAPPVDRELMLAFDAEGDDDAPEPATTATERRADARRCATAAAEVLRQRDFAALHARRVRRGAPADGRPPAGRRAAPLAPACGAAAATAARPDLRRTVRRALRAGGEPIHRAFVEPADAAAAASCCCCDVSGSMEPYARASGALPARRGRRAGPGRGVRLGTRLTRITRELSSRDPDAAIAAAAQRVVDWSGGTRLGEGLREFNDEWGVRGMARGAVVVILSDGWDRGDPEVLAEQMARLAPGRVPGRVGEPAEGVARLRAARPRNGGGPAAR